MLADMNAMATVPVRDLVVAKRFYEGILHLKQCGPDDMGVALYRSGESIIVVYESQHAGSNKATTVTWGVGNELDDVVQSLRKAGVTFEHYDLPGARMENDIHVFGDFRAAWFKDPDGNILHINSASGSLPPALEPL